MDKFGKQIDICVIEEFIRNGKAHIPDQYNEVPASEAERYAAKLMDTLYKYDYDPDFMTLYVVGGGHCLLKRYGKYDENKTVFVEDICAAAKGFETAAKTGTDLSAMGYFFAIKYFYSVYVSHPILNVN